MWQGVFGICGNEFDQCCGRNGTAGYSNKFAFRFVLIQLLTPVALTIAVGFSFFPQSRERGGRDPRRDGIIFSLAPAASGERAEARRLAGRGAAACTAAHHRHPAQPVWERVWERGPEPRATRSFRERVGGEGAHERWLPGKTIRGGGRGRSPILEIC